MQIRENYARKFQIPNVEVIHASSKVELETPNGELINLLFEAGVNVLLTCDKNIFYQQNRKTLPISVITIFTRNTRVEALANYVPEISSLLMSSLEKRFYCAGIVHEKRTDQERILTEEGKALYPADSTYHNKAKIVEPDG